MPEFRSRPEQYPAIGALGKTLQKVDEFARAPFGYDNPPAQMISDFLDIPGVYKTAENINYGSPLTRGTGLARQMTDDTKAGLMGALNLAPGVGAAAKALKGKPVGLTVKPVGNINLRHSVIAEHLKGPDKQKLGDFIKQVKGMKGLTKEGKQSAMSALEVMDPNTVVTKQFVEDSFTPSKFSTIDLAGAARDAEAHLAQMAHDNVANNEFVWDDFANYLDITPDPFHGQQLEDLWTSIHSGDTNLALSKLSPEVKQKLEEHGIINDGLFNPNRLNDFHDEFIHDLIDHEYDYLRMNYEDDVSGDYEYEPYQRLNANTNEGTYTEKGVSHPDAPMSYRHYENASEPLVAHFRGTSNPKSIHMPSSGIDILTHKVKPNSFVIEELQSDAQKGVKQEGPLHQAHATAFKAAVQHALEQGHDTVYLPTADAIGYVRNKSAESFAPIYDQEVVNYGLAPLSRISGVTVNPIKTLPYEGVAYHEINFSPEARDEILHGKGQAFPGFAGGGSVQGPSPFEGLEPTFGDKMGAWVSDKLVGAGINLYDMLADRDKLSAAHKIYLDTFARNRRDPITEKDFNPAELAELQNLIVQKEKISGGKGKGFIKYADYEELPGGDQRKAARANYVGGGLPPRPSLSTSLGQFNYEFDPKTGKYKVIDEYDFNPQQITHEGRKVDVPLEHYGDYAGGGNNKLGIAYGLARLYGGRMMPPGTGRKVDLAVPKKAEGGAVDLRSHYLGSTPAMAEGGAVDLRAHYLGK